MPIADAINVSYLLYDTPIPLTWSPFMSKLADVLVLVFNPLFIIGVTRLYKILDSLPIITKNMTQIFLAQEVHLPISCCIFSIACAALAHEANRNIITLRPNVGSFSLIGMLSFASAGSILMMFYFVVDIKQLPFWLGSYSLLCVVNAVWNFVAVTPETRLPHVLTNIIIPIIIALVLFADVLSRSWLIYLLFVCLAMIKVWQRSRPRVWAPK